MKNENPEPEDLRVRTRQYAVRVIRLYSSLPRNEVARTLGKQLLRSGTSVGAQYREGKRAKSDADLVSKLEGALQELEESEYWLELLEEAAVFSNSRLQPLLSKDYDAVLLKALELDPRHRYENTEAFRKDWQAVRAGRLPKARLAGPLTRAARAGR